MPIALKTTLSLIVIGVIVAAVALWFLQSQSATQAGTSAANGDAAMTTPNSDLDTLARFITLNQQPETALFETRDLPGGSDWTLIAYLEYPAATRDALLQGAQPSPTPLIVANPDWLPEGVAVPADGQGAVLAEEFYSSPLLTGFALPVRDNGIYLELMTQ